MNRQAKAAKTNLKKDPDYYRKIGANGGKKSESWLKGNSEYMSKLAKRGWVKRREMMELKGLEDAQDIKEEMENAQPE